ncbi:N-acetylmuramoyl-L-alanine amidase [Acidobacteriota bacterium]
MFNQKKKTLFYLMIYFFFFLAFSSYAQSKQTLKLSVNDHPSLSRAIIESSIPLNFIIEKNPSSILVTINSKSLLRIQRTPFNSRFIESFGWARGEDSYILTIKMKHDYFTYDSYLLSDPPRQIIDITPDEGRELQEESKRPVKEASLGKQRKTERRSLPSSLQKTIIIDPGHGGLEGGAVGKFGALEKDITLGVSLKLKNIIQRNLAYRVVLTREEDVNVSLETRAAIANNNDAYLFVSIHVNSSYRKKAKGPETFFLNLNATDEEARRLAYLENKSAEFEETIKGENEDDIKMILWDLAQSAYLKQSSQLAESIQKQLNSLLETRNRGIKQAPFKVLTGVACPAVLVEVAFISNPEEERELVKNEFQNNVARAIYRGLVDFLKQYSQE